MSLTEVDWSEVSFVGTEVRTDSQWSGLRNVFPLFSRWPYEDWCRIYRYICEADESVDWKGAGFALCTPDEVDAVAERFRSITHAANEAFRAFLAKVLVNQPTAGHDLIVIEGASAASEDGEGHLCGFSSFV